MANTINNWNTYCGCSGKSSSCDNVFKKVDELPTLGDGSEPTPYFESFSGDVLFKTNNILFDPSKTTRISLDSTEFFDVKSSISYDTAGGCLSERVEAIEAILRNLGHM